jgi:hypothetical protein
MADCQNGSDQDDADNHHQSVGVAKLRRLRHLNNAGTWQASFSAPDGLRDGTEPISVAELSIGAARGLHRKNWDAGPKWLISFVR